MLNNKDVIINLEMLKKYRFYHIFDPNEKKIINRNVYWLAYIVWTVVVQCLVIYGTLGFLVELDDSFSYIDVIMALAIRLHHFQILWQACVFLYRADVIWEILEVTKLNFLKSNRCVENVAMLNDERSKSIRISNIYFGIVVALMFQWLIFPIVINCINWFVASDDVHRRYESIQNLRFPVNVREYNQYYVVYFIIELVIIAYATFSFILFDVFTISICRSITVQYNVLFKAYESVGVNEDISEIEIDNHSENCNEEYQDFLSILSDQIQLHTLLKTYFSTIKTIVFVRVALISSTIVIMTFYFITICSSVESLSTLIIMKVGSSIIYHSFQLFIYCNLINNIHIANGSINFGIYSCNWTMMNLKFQKLVSLAMQMNNATQLILRVSPKKIIDLQLFANVMITCYNIVSVMAKVQKKKNIYE